MRDRSSLCGWLQAVEHGAGEEFTQSLKNIVMLLKGGEDIALDIIHIFQRCDARKRCWIMESICCNTGGINVATFPIVAAGLRDKDREVRYVAAAYLDFLKVDASVAIPVLVTALKDDYDVVRAKAIQVLASYGQQADAAIPELLDICSDYHEWWPHRLRAMEAVIRIGGVPVVFYGESLLRICRNNDEEARRQAVRMLGSLDVDLTNEMEFVVTIINRHIPPSQQCFDATSDVAAILAKYSSVSVPILVGKLADNNRNTRNRLIACLGQLGIAARDAIPALTGIVECAPPYVDSPEVREMALVALCKVDPSGERALPVVVQAMTDAERSMRLCAVKALARLGNAKDGREALVRALEDDDAGVRSAARELMNAIESEVVSPVLSPEDERILRWFDGLKVADWLEKFQLFWCVGRVDEDGLLAAGAAMGFKKLSSRLEELKKNGLLTMLPVSDGHLRGMLEDLESLFNTKPFSVEAWSGLAHSPRLRTPRFRGGREEASWTPRARRAWHYVDRYLTIKGLIPRMIMGKTGPPDLE